MPLGVLLVGLTLLGTVVVLWRRLRAVLFRQNLDGRAFLGGIEPILARGDAPAVLAVCDEVRGTAIGEVVRAAIEAAPEGPEAIDRAMDEAQLDWLPEKEEGRGALASLARVCGAAGMLGAAIEMRAAFGDEEGAPGLTGVVLALGGGILGVVISLYGRSLVIGNLQRIIDETATAARRLPELLAAGAAAPGAGRDVVL